MMASNATPELARVCRRVGSAGRSQAASIGFSSARPRRGRQRGASTWWTCGRGATVYSKNERQFFVPASNTKLFSTALALVRLGPDYRFRTTIAAPAKPDADGRVAELRFVGGGSPNLSARTMPYEYDSPWADPLRHVDAFAQQLVDSGVRIVDGGHHRGRIRLYRRAVSDGWALDDPVFDYGAPVYSLFVNDGMFRVRVTPGTPPSIEVTPPMPGLAIHNRVSNGSPTKLTYSRLPGSSELTVSGVVNREVEGDLGMENPPLYAAEALREALVARGVQVRGAVRVENFPAPGVPLVSHDSEPLIETLKVINKESVNLHAEIVLLEVARARTGTGTRKAGLEEMAAFLQEIGIAKEQYHLRDGSGLSRHTLLTPATITKLLIHMHRSPFRERWGGLAADRRRGRHSGKALQERPPRPSDPREDRLDYACERAVGVCG
jgi:serine-type D-Ala-D-Ala carboxypeptidase/endopeptidase (penicillin-binding protein 4)